jgi:hypothetical protein
MSEQEGWTHISIRSAQFSIDDASTWEQVQKGVKKEAF